MDGADGKRRERGLDLRAAGAGGVPELLVCVCERERKRR
jgi:hypothetical protein